jgi:glucose-1-phosphate cytidylyltransferase
MKVVLLAGGLGTRLTEETEIRPKPMVEIGGRPILWHIMKHYAHYGFQEFLVALGYKGEYIKRYFLDYYTLNGSMTIDLASGEVQPQVKECENWKLHLLETGLQTNTGGRLKRLESYIGKETFMITYGAHIPIYSPDRIAETKPDYLLILPWNLRSEIVEQMVHIREWGGKFILPIPQLEII